MKVITIGRSEENDRVITDPCTSRHHLQIIQHDDGHFTLSDFGSTNGTYVNGQKISGEIPLKDTDIVRIGNTTIPWRMYFDEEVLLVQETPKTEDNTAVQQLHEDIDGKTDELNNELKLGGKYVVYTYAISIVVMTFRRSSKRVYFIKHDESAIKHGWPYLLISLFLGWWGIPFGPIYTIQSIYYAFCGKDVTREVIDSRNTQD